MICYTAYICMVWPPACEFVYGVEDQLLSQKSGIKNEGNIHFLLYYFAFNITFSNLV